MHITLHGNDSERQDVEIAHEIQEQLVRQAEQQRQQEEKDAVRTHDAQTRDQSSLPTRTQCRLPHPPVSGLISGTRALSWMGPSV